MLTIKNKTILLFGYYGKSNIGDDIMLINLVELLVNKKAKKIIVLVDKSFNMEEDFDSRIIFLKGLKSNAFTFLFQLLTVNYFIWGGGTCFFDNPSIRGLKELFYFTKLRKIFSAKKKNYFIGIGVEKVVTRKEIINKILNNTDGVILRDKKSKQNFLELNDSYETNMDFLEVFDDMVFMESTKKMLDEIPVNEGFKNYITFSGHYKYENNDEVIKHTALELIKVMDVLQVKQVIFLPAKYDENGDTEFHLKVKKEVLSMRDYVLDVPEIIKIKDYITLLKSSHKHIGMRLHSLVLADLLILPNIALSYQEKINQYNKNAVGILSNWSTQEFVKSDKDKINILLKKNTNNYEGFFN